MTTPPDRAGTASAFSFDLLRREPDVEAPDLVAVDATDRLLLDEAAPSLAAAAAEGPGGVVVVGDRYGALTLGAVVLHGAVDVRVHQDGRTGELALAANAARVGLDGAAASFRSMPFTPDLVRGARLVLLQLPRSLEALDDVAALVAAHAAPGVVLLAGGRVKHMTHAMNDVLARHFTDVRARLARQKSRVLVASGPRPADRAADDGAPGATGDDGAGVLSADADRWGVPTCVRHDDLDLTVCAYPGAFAGARVDRGTRAMLPLLEQAVPGASSVVDLGCGTGVLAVVVARTRPGAQVLATDASAAAVASARATVAANGLAGRVSVRQEHGLTGVADGSVDLVVLNPPFHTGAAVHTGVAQQLFAEAARVLRPGGELWAVWNSHLQYRPVLERVVGPTRQVQRNPTFTVTASRRG